MGPQLPTHGGRISIYLLSVLVIASAISRIARQRNDRPELAHKFGGRGDPVPHERAIDVGPGYLHEYKP